MKCIFCFFFALARSCLVSVQFSEELHPSFQSYDTGPYLAVFQQTDITVSFEATDAFKVLVNEVEVVDASLQATITVELPPGSSSLTVTCADLIYSFELFAVSLTEPDYVVTIDDEEAEKILK